MSGYSFWKAALVEVKRNPIRTIFATLPLFLATGTYLIDRWFPDVPLVQASAVLLQKTTAGQYQGDLQLVSDAEIPVRSVSGQYFMIAFDGRENGRKGFATSSGFGMAANPQVVIESPQVPKIIVLCLRPENRRGGGARQEIQMAVDGAAGAAQNFDTLALFKSAPESNPGRRRS